MISLGLAFSFGAEALFYILICAWLWDISVVGLPIGMIGVVVVTLFIAMRVATLLVEFALSYWRGSLLEPEAQASLVQTARMILTEVMCFLLLICLLLPFSRRLVLSRRGTVARSRQLPVLFIPGYACNAGIWVPMINYLDRHGLTNIFTMNLEPTLGNIDDFAQQVAARVERICNTTRTQKVIIVGHSMGGLVARAYVERCGGAGRVAKVISIGTPHHGTLTARLAPGANAGQMRIGSAWLRELNREENVSGNIEHVSIYSAHDNVVIPQISAELGKAKNIRLIGKGHFSLVFSREVGQLVYREIVAA
jgi:pimeloyl-ACP methyl ester carboxylesterase